MTVKSKQSGIVRTGTGTADIRAYVNSCLHRGTILRTEGGNVRHLNCPVHGLTWGLGAGRQAGRTALRLGFPPSGPREVLPARGTGWPVGRVCLHQL